MRRTHNGWPYVLLRLRPSPGAAGKSSSLVAVLEVQMTKPPLDTTPSWQDWHDLWMETVLSYQFVFEWYGVGHLRDLVKR